MTRIVVLNHDGGPLLLDCLASLRALDWPADRLEIVVVDNASKDGSPDAAEHRYPTVRIIRNASNDGFSANNLAMTPLDGVDQLALVNPDAHVEPGWLRALSDALAADDGLGAACPRMLLEPRFVDVTIDCTRPIAVDAVRVDGADRTADAHRYWRLLPADRRPGTTTSHTADGSRATWSIPVPPRDDDGAGTHRLELLVRTDRDTVAVVGGHEVALGTTARSVGCRASDAHDVVNNAGLELRPDGYVGDRGLGQRDDERFASPTEVFGWTGGGVLLRADMLRDVGLFDPVYFLYYEDADLSWRARARGWRFVYVPTATMRHHHAASTREGSALFAHHTERNRLVMVLQNAPLGFALTASLRFLVSTLGYVRADVLGPALRGRRPDASTVRRRLASFASVCRLLPRVARRRRVLRGRRTVDDRAVLDWIVPPAIAERGGPRA